VDEAHYPVPTSTYALSKVASETVAERVCQWSGIPFVALRFSNIMAPADYQKFPSFWPDPHARKWNLWGYVDVRDVGYARSSGHCTSPPGRSGGPGQREPSSSR
jgi:nucleoside-diphosphate-sugar epimerase